MGSKYQYEGVPLDEYCKSHGLNVNTQRNRIKRYANEHPELSLDKVTKIVLDKCGTIYCKYKYDGMSLSNYCEKNKLNYSSMIDRVISVKNANKDISDDEATRIAVEEKGGPNIKYFYDGIPLADYCRLHPEYNYTSIITYISRKLEKNPKENVQKIINSYFLTEHKSHTYHFVDGIALYEYCETNGIVYRNILSRLCLLRNNPKYRELTEQERLTIALSMTPKNYLYFEGVYLAEYCRKNNYSYNSVYNYVIKTLKENPDMDLNKAIYEALANIKANGIKYYYLGEPLINYCEKNGMIGKLVRDRVTNILKTDSRISLEEAISLSVKYYERKKYIKDLNKIFEFLKNKGDIEEEELNKIISFLNIDVNNVKLLRTFVPRICDCISIIWFFHDNKDNEKLSISLECYKMLINKVNSLQFLSRKNIRDVDIIFLIFVYKTNLLDCRHLMIWREKAYIFSRIKHFLNLYDIETNNDFKNELYNHLCLELLELIEKTNNNNPSMVMSYIKKSIDGRIKVYFEKYFKINNSTISLNKLIDNNSSKNKRSLEEIIATPTIERKSQFGEELVKVLSTLNKQEIDFIVYKFQLRFSDEEIARIMRMDLLDLLVYEKNILDKLKDNNNVKTLAHKYRIFT